MKNMHLFAITLLLSLPFATTSFVKAEDGVNNEQVSDDASGVQNNEAKESEGILNTVASKAGVWKTSLFENLNEAYGFLTASKKRKAAVAVTAVVIPTVVAELYNGSVSWLYKKVVGERDEDDVEMRDFLKEIDEEEDKTDK